MNSNVAAILTQENLINPSLTTVVAPDAVTARPSPLRDAAPAAALPVPLYELLARVAPYPTGTLQEIFLELARILDYLQLAAIHIRQDRMMLSTLSILKHVRKDAQALSSLIESLAHRNEDFPPAVCDEFDCLSFAIRHEVERVFDKDIIGFADDLPQFVGRAKLESAHGLLRNCLQQSTIALARVFAPAFDGACLFDDLAERRQQSQLLMQELQDLVKHARCATGSHDQFAAAVMAEHLKRFRKGTMCYLMYKDWEECERFIEQLAQPHSPGTTGPLLENLCAYLETLLIHVGRRSELSDSALYFPDTQH